MTRAMVKVPDPRNVMVAIKCSKSERNDIRREAKSRKMNVSEYLRRCHELMSAHEERARELLVAIEQVNNRRKRAKR